MSSRFARIAAGTLLSGALFVGAGAAPAFAAEGDDARDSNSSLPQNVNVYPQINIGANIAIAVNKGDGHAHKGDGHAHKGDGGATAVAVQEQGNNSNTNQGNGNI
jgi:hypothetical protein